MAIRAGGVPEGKHGIAVGRIARRLRRRILRGPSGTLGDGNYQHQEAD
jgi:hypothetical protein